MQSIIIMQGTIPPVPSGDQSSSGGSSGSDQRKLLASVHKDEDDSAVQLDPRMVLYDAVTLGHYARLRASTTPMSRSLRQLHELAVELRYKDPSSPKIMGARARYGLLGRSLLQTPGGGSCGGLVNTSQLPGSNSSIASFSILSTNCDIQPILPETVIMANILGAVASTSSAIGAIQVSFYVGFTSAKIYEAV